MYYECDLPSISSCNLECSSSQYFALASASLIRRDRSVFPCTLACSLIWSFLFFSFNFVFETDANWNKCNRWHDAFFFARLRGMMG